MWSRHIIRFNSVRCPETNHTRQHRFPRRVIHMVISNHFLLFFVILPHNPYPSTSSHVNVILGRIIFSFLLSLFTFLIVLFLSRIWFSLSSFLSYYFALFCSFLQFGDIPQLFFLLGGNLFLPLLYFSALLFLPGRGPCCNLFISVFSLSYYSCGHGDISLNLE